MSEDIQEQLEQFERELSQLKAPSNPFTHNGPQTWASAMSSVVVPGEVEDVQSYVEVACDWAVVHGLVSGLPISSGIVGVRHVPFALYPTPFPRNQYHKAIDVQPYFNILMHRARSDFDFLLENLQAAGEVDEFTGKLVRILKTVQTEGVGQSISLAIHRADYMLHEASEDDAPVIKQVEINTISAAFGALTTITSNLHRYLFGRFGLGATTPDTLPTNNALPGIADALGRAVNIYTEKYGVAGAVLMVVQPEERNSFDQRWLEFALWERHGIKLLRRSLFDIEALAEFRDDRALLIDGHHISVVYFRAGYSPKDYPTAAEWTARLNIERCRAIKSPSITDHLSGSKKIQQVLAQRDVLTKFIPEEDIRNDIESTFMGLYSLDETTEHASVIERAKEDPDSYVMKPQREGNNVYRAELRHLLETLSPKERSAYILMERIKIPSRKNYLVRDGWAELGDVVSELGVYGVMITDGPDVLLNEAVGTLLRTKLINFDDGGVAAGVAVLDSPFLVRGDDEL